jgi:hypothetical protein
MDYNHGISIVIGGFDRTQEIFGEEPGKPEVAHTVTHVPSASKQICFVGIPKSSTAAILKCQINIGPCGNHHIDDNDRDYKDRFRCASYRHL